MASRKRRAPESSVATAQRAASERRKEREQETKQRQEDTRKRAAQQPTALAAATVDPRTGLTIPAPGAGRPGDPVGRGANLAAQGKSDGSFGKPVAAAQGLSEAANKIAGLGSGIMQVREKERRALADPALFVANDNQEQWFNPPGQPDGVYLASPDGSGGFTYADVAPTWGMADEGMSRGVTLADLDRDGWLDTAKRDLAGESLLYLSRCGDEGWLTVHLRDPGSMNTYGVGAVVTATVGDLTMSRTVMAGGTGFASSGPPELHFGLGVTDKVDTLTVRWTDGRVDTLHDLTARQEVTLTR